MYINSECQSDLARVGRPRRQGRSLRIQPPSHLENPADGSRMGLRLQSPTEGRQSPLSPTLARHSSQAIRGRPNGKRLALCCLAAYLIKAKQLGAPHLKQKSCSDIIYSSPNVFMTHIFRVFYYQGRSSHPSRYTCAYHLPDRNTYNGLLSFGPDPKTRPVIGRSCYYLPPSGKLARQK